MARFTHILVIFSAFALVACGKSEAPKTATANTAAPAKDAPATAKPTPATAKPAPATAKPAPATAKPAGKNGLLGKWTLDIEGMKQFDEFKKLPPEQQKMALAMVSANLFCSWAVHFVHPPIMLLRDQPFSKTMAASSSTITPWNRKFPS